MTTKKPRGLYTKILELQKTLTNIETNATAETADGGSFRYTKAEDVVDTVVGQINELGLVFLPGEECTVEHVGGVSVITQRWEIIDPETEAKHFFFTAGEGHGNDAVAKANTGARKYALAFIGSISFPRDNNESNAKSYPTTSGAKRTWKSNSNNGNRRSYQ